MSKIILDLEFTGLDNQFISDNEIVQAKMINAETGKSIIKNFGSNKNLSAHVQIGHKVLRYFKEPLFDVSIFAFMLSEIGAEYGKCEYFGFGIDSDFKMLCKYDIEINITDIRTHYQLTEFELRMATEGSGLEETYLIVTGKYPEISNHSDLSELYLIKELYDSMTKYEKKDYFSIMPHGFCAGMPLSMYVSAYRRQADGYRYNNHDMLSRSLSYHISLTEEDEDDEYDMRW